MGFTAGLLVCVLLGQSDGASKPEAAANLIFETKVIDVDAARWRDRHYFDLKRHAVSGNATVWTASESVAAAIEAVPGAKVLAAPRVVTTINQEAFADMRTPMKVMTDLERRADGPIHHASKSLTYKPVPRTVHEGVAVRVSAAPTAAGLALKARVESEWVTLIQGIVLHEMYLHGDGREDIIKSQIQIPEVTSSAVNVECAVDTGDSLIVSLGARRREKDGEAGEKLLERIVVITPSVLANNRAVTVTATDDPVPFRMRPVKRVLLKAPSRSLPEAVADKGEPMPLPPLPESRMVQAEPDMPKTDPAVSRTNRVSEKFETHTNSLAIGFSSRATDLPGLPGIVRLTIDGAFLASGRTQRLNIPLGGGLCIALEAKLEKTPSSRVKVD